MKVFAPRIAGFVKEHSGINLNVQVSASGHGLRKVVDGEVDLAVGFYESVPRGVRKIKVQETVIQLICPPRHPLLKSHVTLEEIARHRIITLPRVSMTRRKLSSAFAKKNVNVQNIIEVGGCQTAIELVKLGLGVALVHSICAGVQPRDEIASADMTHLFGTIDVGAVARPEILANPIHKAFMSVFTDDAEEGAK
jgi:DNA-binding transcriptional LysR family regulator